MYPPCTLYFTRIGGRRKDNDNAGNTDYPSRRDTSPLLHLLAYWVYCETRALTLCGAPEEYLSSQALIPCFIPLLSLSLSPSLPLSLSFFSSFTGSEKRV